MLKTGNQYIDNEIKMFKEILFKSGLAKSSVYNQLAGVKEILLNGIEINEEAIENYFLSLEDKQKYDLKKRRIGALRYLDWKNGDVSLKFKKDKLRRSKEYIERYQRPKEEVQNKMLTDCLRENENEPVATIL